MFGKFVSTAFLPKKIYNFQNWGTLLGIFKKENKI